MLHFVMASTILLGIMLCTYSTVMLIDEINMNGRYGEYSPRSYVIWGLILMISLSAVAISWVNLPGSKWFVAMYFGPALLLVLLTALFVSREWFGTTFVFALCATWIVFGGFAASAQVYNTERGGSLGKSDGCYYERAAGTLRYEWNCNNR
jgi:hypothetical protein